MFYSFLQPGMRFATFFLLLGGLAGTANADISPPTCPGPDCQKVITFYNNTSTPVFAVIQAGIQNPDPWLQALFNSTLPYAETHYSRVYVNPLNGIPAKGHVSVTVPWYSKLTNDTDTYIDWYNGCRLYFFDTKEALSKAHDADKNSPLSLASGSPVVSCPNCEQPLTIYSDKLAFPTNIPFQLMEYTFADVKTSVSPPSIIDLNVGYNVSYLDQIYLPLALAPCRTEPCNGLDATAFGYLGTVQALDDFRKTLTKFSNDEGWPRYNAPLDDAKRPRLPGTYNVLVDRVNVIEKGQPSEFTEPGVSVTDLINQWKTCTSNKANTTNCPQFQTYQEINNYFKANYAAYTVMPKPTDCTQGLPYYPSPATLDSLNIMPYVYGWVPFNSGCGPAFNALKSSPGPLSAFEQALFDYVHKLQYNYQSVELKAQRFNPFVDLIHARLGANGYAFSVDDAVSFENHPGEGLIITIGGATGLPNPKPVVPPPNYAIDFSVNLGDSKPLNRPLWKSFGVCKDVADTDFPPLPPGAPDTPLIIVDTVAYQISPAKPCTITVKDASNRKYQFTIKMAVPWPVHSTGSGFDPQVLTCVNKNDGWCNNINELSVLGPPPQFALFTPPPLAQP